jgi:hypothetical protein
MDTEYSQRRVRISLDILYQLSAGAHSGLINIRYDSLNSSLDASVICRLQVQRELSFQKPTLSSFIFLFGQFIESQVHKPPESES